MGASANLDHIYFESSAPLTPSRGDGLFDYSNGILRHIGGGVGNGSRRALFFPGFNPIAADNSRIFHTFGDSLQVLDGGTSNPISSPAVFRGAEKETGSTAFFSSKAQLTADSTARDEPCGAGADCEDLYRWQADAPPGDQIVDLTTGDPQGAGFLGMVGMSDNAAYVYFVATGVLAPGASRGAPNLYLWIDGIGTRYVATLLEPSGPGADVFFSGDANVFGRRLYGNGFGGARVTPDGRHLLFDSFAQLTPYKTGGHKQLYLYEADTEQLKCVSCSPRSDESEGNAYLSLPAERESDKWDAGPFLHRNISVDGEQIFFDSEEPLVVGDTNGVADVYEWADGEVHLISGGEGADDSTFVGASDDGNDAFFATRQRLTRSDQDTFYDIYDARVGGLIEPAPIPSCEGDECQGTPTPPAEFDKPSTAATGAPTSTFRTKHRHRRRHKHRRRKHPGRSSHTATQPHFEKGSWR